MGMLEAPGTMMALVGGLLFILLFWSLLRLLRAQKNLSLLSHAIDSVSTGIILTDARQPGHPIVSVNSAFARLTGYESHAIVGRTSRILEGPDTDTQTMNGIDAALRDGNPCHSRIKLYKYGGKPFWSEVTISPIRDTKSRLALSLWELTEVSEDEPALWIPRPKEASLENPTDEGRVAQRQGVLHAAATVLAESSDLGEAASELLRVMCEYLDWDKGILWVVDRPCNELRCQAVWPLQAGTTASSDTMPPNATCASGEGLAGLVWTKGEPEWISGILENPHGSQRSITNLASATGRCGLAYPVKIAGRVHAVFEFYGTGIRPQDPSITSMLAAVACQTTQLIRRVQAEERCQALEAHLRYTRKGEAVINLAGGIAHDLNNTLAAILGFAELASPVTPAVSRARTHLKQIIKAGNRAKDLIQQILNFARHGERRRAPVKLHVVVTEALKLLRPSLPATIELREAMLTESDTILADPVQVHQILVDLVTRAEYALRETGGLLEVRLDEVQPTPEQAKVHLSLESKAYVRLTVRDTGSRMPGKVGERMPEPTYTTEIPAEGAWTGLDVVKEIVASHGGTILVDSAPEQGTTVEVYFPQIENRVAGERVSSASLPTGTERILFVEDEETLAQLGREMLETLGYETVVRTDPKDALTAFLTIPQRFDLVITDQTMPQMTGDILAREMLRVRPDLPIVLLTGFSHVMDWEKAKALGIQAYLKKPLSLYELAVGIRQVLDGKSKDCRGKAERPETDENLRETLTQPT